jgi:hypothetical protein
LPLAATVPLSTLLVRLSDRVGGGPRAVANAADAVNRDQILAQQRDAAWTAVTDAQPNSVQPAEPRA